MADHVYLNGKIIPKAEATVSVFDRGFLLGDGIFETMRAYNGRIFQLDAHLNRLAKSAAVMEIPLPSLRDLERAIGDTLQANNLKEAAVRLTITRGAGPLGLVPPADPAPTVLVIAEALKVLSSAAYEKGVAVSLAPDRHPYQTRVTQIKTTSFAGNVLGTLHRRREKTEEVIFLNERGAVVEGAISNIFIVSGGYVITPFEEDGLLPGVTRDIVLQLCEKLFIPSARKSIVASELWGAQECFLTGSTKEILPVTRVEAHRVGNGIVGPVTKRLMEGYREVVQKETGS